MYIGIDFGTSFSQIATNVLDVPTLLLAPGEYGVPSSFFYSDENGVLIGDEANDAGVGMDAVNLVREVKMKLDKEFILDGRRFDAPDIVKEIFRNVITKGTDIANKKNINSEIEGAVITVPAKFGMQQRAIIREAARTCMPGKVIHISDIIKEPVAAALAYYKTEAENEKNILVYDLGGGTCDIALVRSDDSLQEHYEVVDSDMELLGGRDWDRKLYEFLIEELSKKNVYVTGNPSLEEKVIRAANKVKHDLSDEFRTTVRARIEIDGRIVMIPVSRQKFEDITRDLLDKSLDCLKRVYYRNTNCRIEDIILVGGSSNMLQVREGVQREFPNCEIKIFEPELAVVKGASVYSNMIMNAKVSSILQDKCNFSYGIKLYDNYDENPDYFIVANVIYKDTVLPASGSKSAFTIEQDQRSLRYQVFESEYTMSQYDFDNTERTFVGDVILDLPSNLPKSTETYCDMTLNNQGLLEVQGRGPNDSFVKAEFKLSKY